jgi:hypothetical protein
MTFETVSGLFKQEHQGQSDLEDLGTYIEDGGQPSQQYGLAQGRHRESIFHEHNMCV